MKSLIFIPENKIIKVFTPNMERLGTIQFNTILNSYVWNQTNDKFLTLRRMEEIAGWFRKWDSGKQ